MTSSSSIAEDGPLLKKAKPNDSLHMDTEDSEFNNFLLELELQSSALPIPPPQHPVNGDIYHSEISQLKVHTPNENNTPNGHYIYKKTQANSHNNNNTDNIISSDPTAQDTDNVKPDLQLNDEINNALLNFNEFNDTSLSKDTEKDNDSSYSPSKQSRNNTHALNQLAFDTSLTNQQKVSHQHQLHGYNIKNNSDLATKMNNSSSSDNLLSNSASVLSSSSTPSNLLFDSPDTATSVLSHEDDQMKKHEIRSDEIQQGNFDKQEQKSPDFEQTEKTSPVNLSTIASIKLSMLNTSKMISTFTTLKTTYLKLCKEFNYLLSKFNDNERIKIELIHENNELKKLLTTIITQRELERKKFKKSKLQDKLTENYEDGKKRKLSVCS